MREHPGPVMPHWIRLKKTHRWSFLGAPAGVILEFQDGGLYQPAPLTCTDPDLVGWEWTVGEVDWFEPSERNLPWKKATGWQAEQIRKQQEAPDA